MRSWGSCHGTPCHHPTRSQCSTSTGRPQILNRAAHLEFGKFPPPSPTQSGRLDERMRSQSGSTERGSRSRGTLEGDRLRNGWNIVQEHKRRLVRWVNVGIKTIKELENSKTWNDIDIFWNKAADGLTGNHSPSTAITFRPLRKTMLTQRVTH